MYTPLSIGQYVLGFGPVSLSLLPLSRLTMERFVSWFQSHNGHIDTEAIGFHTFPDLEGGRGTVALRDIPVRERFCSFF